MKTKTVLGMMCLLFFFVAACEKSIGPGNTAPGEAGVVKAPVAKAAISQEPLVYEAVATINAQTASTISAKLMGTVQAVHVQEGDLVEKGDLLVTIDPRTVTSRLDQAKAGLAEAKRAEASAISSREAAAAAAQLASATYKRYRQLLAEHSVSKQEYDEVESRFRQAKATQAQTEAMVEAASSRVQQAEAAVNQAVLAQKDARVLAPYTGRVVSKMVDTGTLASPGVPLLVVERQGLYNAELVLPERHIQAVKVDMPVTVNVPALDNVELKGRISHIVPVADARSRSFEIKVRMPEDLDLKSGMFARVFVPLGGTGILMVPRTAVVKEGQLTGVFLVDDTHTARFRLVRTGKVLGDRLEIISGLKEGLEYVADVPVTLKDGMKVEAI